MTNSRRFLIYCFTLSQLLALSACSTIPSNTTVLLDKTSDRIETRSEVITNVLRTTLDESTFAKKDIEMVRKALESINTSKLSTNDKKIITDSVSTLTKLETNLGAISQYTKVPDDSKRIFTESVNSLKLVREVIASEIDKKTLLQNAIDALEINKDKGDAK
jgi:hypothetical protein